MPPGMGGGTLFFYVRGCLTAVTRESLSSSNDPHRVLPGEFCSLRPEKRFKQYDGRRQENIPAMMR